MQRPRWHDAVIVAAIVGVLALGVWALWWDDVSAAMGWGAPGDPARDPAPPSSGQT